MNKAITDGLVLMPPPFSAGLNLWSRGDGTPGSAAWQGQPNAALVTNDQDFAGCLELQKTEATQKLRSFAQTPIQPGLYLRVTARVKAVSGNLPSVRIAAWAGDLGGANVVAGLISGLANAPGMGGLPVAAFFAAQPMAAATFRATLIAYFPLLDLYSAPLYWWHGLVTWNTL